MRDFVVVGFVFAGLPVALLQPYYGLLLYSWVSYMYPHLRYARIARFSRVHRFHGNDWMLLFELSAHEIAYPRPARPGLDSELLRHDTGELRCAFGQRRVREYGILGSRLPVGWDRRESQSYLPAGIERCQGGQPQFASQRPVADITLPSTWQPSPRTLAVGLPS